MVCALFTLVGLGVFCWGVYSLHENSTFRERALTAQGQVVKLEYRRSNDGGSYYPIVRWIAPDGSAHRFKGRFGTSPSAYDVGEEVEVLYDPADRSDARLGGAMGWAMPVLLLVMGVVFVFVSWLMWTTPARERRLRDRLRRHGRPIRAEVVHGLDAMLEQARRILAKIPGMQEKLSAAANAPDVLVASWHDPRTGQAHYFYFTDLPVEQRERLRAAGHIDLLIDPKNPQEYILR